ncbi:glutaredoxin 3 [Marinicella gelatinilytica]|uniref:glutaredoxin 3 n=1 Tax=Marinicella gelatinilytica TaxID=2996017 RepID=UPI002260CB22|nr:glutaredoxin 3 [Marinicella gelatinilytica]MCX7545536.1 glutaredoxin 3 [Marinicella gelatinilytica]
MKNEIIVYSTRICPFCVAAKNLLTSQNLDYQEIMVDKDPEQRAIMMEKSGRTSVPQIFINGTHVGGFDDLNAKVRNNELNSLLR